MPVYIEEARCLKVHSVLIPHNKESGAMQYREIPRTYCSTTFVNKQMSRLLYLHLFPAL